MSLNLTITPGTLPSPLCPATYQDLWNAFAAAGSVSFPYTLTGIVASAAKPDPSTQGVNAWLQLDASGRPIRLYWYAAGSWLSQHPQVPGATMIWLGTLPDFTTFDGGDASTAGVASGPMWQQATSLNAAFPVGVGTFPSGTPVAVGGTGGEEKHTLITSEMPSHTHTVTVEPTTSAGGNPTTLNQGAGLNLPSSSTGGDQPHNTLPPYVGVYFLQRTARLFYSVP